MKVNLGTIELTHEDLVYIGQGKKATRIQAREWCISYILKKINRKRRGGLFDGPALFEEDEEKQFYGRKRGRIPSYARRRKR